MSIAAMSDVISLRRPFFKPIISNLERKKPYNDLSISYLIKEKDIMKLYLNLQKLDSIERLDNNWNGYGATRFDNKIINLSKELLFKFGAERQPEIFPTGRNSIQFEFYKDNEYLELEVYHNYTNVYKECDNGTYEEYKIENISDIKNTVDNFYGYGCRG